MQVLLPGPITPSIYHIIQLNRPKEKWKTAKILKKCFPLNFLYRCATLQREQEICETVKYNKYRSKIGEAV